MVWPMSSAATASAILPELDIGAFALVWCPFAEHALTGEQGARNIVESSRSMPWSFMTSATAEISASVFRALRRLSTDSRVRSGMMAEKILT